MKISEIITDKYKLRIPPTVYYDLLADVVEAEEEQEPKTGYREYNDIYDHYLCGNCKTVVMDYDNYCPNCGAKMQEAKDES